MEALDMMYSEIAVAHIHDNDGVSDRHWAAGLGNIDWKRFMPKLARAPRMLSMEDEGIFSELPVAELCQRTSKLLEYAALPL
jgi:sugar phosphate isomerase/epimerase